MKQYYTMDEKFQIQAAYPDFNHGVEETIRHLASQGKLFPSGEVMCVICEARKTWISSNTESLIGVIENRKRPMYYLDLDF